MYNNTSSSTHYVSDKKALVVRRWDDMSSFCLPLPTDAGGAYWLLVISLMKERTQGMKNNYNYKVRSYNLYVRSSA